MPWRRPSEYPGAQRQCGSGFYLWNSNHPYGPAVSISYAGRASYRRVPNLRHDERMEMSVQPFHAVTRSLARDRIDQSGERPSETPPTPGIIAREAGVIVLACLGLALAAALLLRMLGTH